MALLGRVASSLATPHASAILPARPPGAHQPVEGRRRPYDPPDRPRSGTGGVEPRGGGRGRGRPWEAVAVAVAVADGAGTIGTMK